MSVKTKIVKTKEEKIVSIACDNCGKEVSIENDIFEAQEFLRIKETAGYGSVFGDSNTIECDLCQGCVKKLLGHVIRITTNS